MFDKVLAIAFSSLILLQAYLVRRRVGTWIFPASLFGLFWFGYTFVPLVILIWVPVDPFAIGYILVCALAFSAGSFLLDWKSAFKSNTQLVRVSLYNSAFLRKSLYICSALALLFLAINMSNQGFSVADLIFNLWASAAMYANLHYSGDIQAQQYEYLSMIFAYVAASLGGLVFTSATQKNQRRLVLVSSFLPSVLVALTQSAKGLLFFCAALFCGGLLAVRISSGQQRIITKGSIKRIAVVMILLLAIVTMAFLGRGLYKIQDSGELFHQLASYFASYSSGHVYAFADWFAFITGRHSEFSYGPDKAGHGFYTFMTLFSQLGDKRDLPAGVFDEYFKYEDLLRGNIYTMFRGLILDFGFLGSILFMFISGVLLHGNFNSMLRNRAPVLPVVVFVFMLGFMYMSFIISAMIWFYIYVSFALLWLLLLINKNLVIRKMSSTFVSKFESNS